MGFIARSFLVRQNELNYSLTLPAALNFNIRAFQVRAIPREDDKCASSQGVARHHFAKTRSRTNFPTICQIFFLD